MPTRYAILDLDELIRDYEPDAPAVDRLRIAQALLTAAIGVLDQVAKETDDRHARAYLVDQLTCLASSDHGFLSRDFNLDAWIEQLKCGDEEDDEG